MNIFLSTATCLFLVPSAHGVYTCPDGMRPFKDTPTKGVCSCGNDWSAANAGKIKCGSSGKPDKPAENPAPPNKACPSWVTDPNAYRYSAEDWGGDATYGINNNVMVVGQGKFAGAKTTACIWVANCKGDDECIRSCPIAVGAAYEESQWHPKAQSYDGIGRGLYQWGGASAPSCSRGFVGKECNVVYNISPNGGSFTAVSGSGPQATVADCSAYNPVLNTQRTISMTKNGKNWHPTGNAWWSCGAGTKKIKRWSSSKANSLKACVQASSKPESFFTASAAFANGDCAVGTPANGVIQRSAVCEKCGDNTPEGKKQYCGSSGSPPAPVQKDSCPQGMQPFKDTPSKGVCSCGKTWAEANAGKIKCGSSKKPNPPAPVQKNGCPQGMQPFKDTPSKGVCSCGKTWAEANTGTIRCGSSKKPAPVIPAAPVQKNGCPEGMQPFKDTPSKGVCSCGKTWAEANAGNIKCGSSKKPAPSPPRRNLRGRKKL